MANFSTVLQFSLQNGFILAQDGHLKLLARTERTGTVVRTSWRLLNASETSSIEGQLHFHNSGVASFASQDCQDPSLRSTDSSSFDFDNESKTSFFFHLPPETHCDLCTTYIKPLDSKDTDSAVNTLCTDAEILNQYAYAISHHELVKHPIEVLNMLISHCSSCRVVFGSDTSKGYEMLCDVLQRKRTENTSQSPFSMRKEVNKIEQGLFLLWRRPHEARHIPPMNENEILPLGLLLDYEPLMHTLQRIPRYLQTHLLHPPQNLRRGAASSASDIKQLDIHGVVQYTVRLFIRGLWEYITVDDCVLCNGRELIASPNPIQKALALSLGGFHNLHDSQLTSQELNIILRGYVHPERTPDTTSSLPTCNTDAQILIPFTQHHPKLVLSMKFLDHPQPGDQLIFSFYPDCHHRRSTSTPTRTICLLVTRPVQEARIVVRKETAMSQAELECEDSYLQCVAKATSAPSSLGGTPVAALVVHPSSVHINLDTMQYQRDDTFYVIAQSLNAREECVSGTCCGSFVGSLSIASSRNSYLAVELCAPHPNDHPSLHDASLRVTNAPFPITTSTVYVNGKRQTAMSSFSM